MVTVGTLGNVVLDCQDPQGLAEFYAAVMGGEVHVDPDGDWADLTGAAAGVTVSFQLAPQLRAPRWPDPKHPQQFHFDLYVADLDVGQEQVLALGATLLDGGDGERSFRVFQDPAGHPFCLCLR
jgi:catechol 2,3-dioxygenase-like lactoylglutathione lyase family enzyme